MSKEDKYYTVPLSVLRSGQSLANALENCLHVGIVNAGIGFKKINDEEEYELLLDRAREQADKEKAPIEPPKNLKLRDASGTLISLQQANELRENALAGWKLLNIHGGKPEDFAQSYLTHYRKGEVFFRIKSDWLWNAIYTARRESGMDTTSYSKPMSWREFRILAAILSAKVNTYGFTFLGWESIQALACGYHNKKLFCEGRASLPAHCQPLSRQMIRDACENLEALGCFARCRYARGERGGFSAYSFRHPKRDDLIASVKQWDDANRSFKTKTKAFRNSDKLAFSRANRPPT